MVRILFFAGHGNYDAFFTGNGVLFICNWIIYYRIERWKRMA